MMDLVRLTLAEAALMSKVIETLGTGATIDGLVSCINVLEACESLYRKELAELRETTRSGE